MTFIYYIKRYLRRCKIENMGLSYKVYNMYDLTWFRSMDFNLIIDVGAARGEHALVLHHFFPKAVIHAFEPLPNQSNKLKANTSGIPQIITHDFALDETDGSAKMNVCEDRYVDSSSIMPMTRLHEEAYPGSRPCKIIEIKTKRMDEVLTAEPTQKTFVKIDVQGAEARVVKGGERFLRSAHLIVAEVSLFSLYEGAARFDEFGLIMNNLGFSFGGVLDQNLDTRSKEIMQVDCIFVRSRESIR